MVSCYHILVFRFPWQTFYYKPFVRNVATYITRSRTPDIWQLCLSLWRSSSSTTSPPLHFLGQRTLYKACLLPLSVSSLLFNIQSLKSLVYKFLSRFIYGYRGAVLVWLAQHPLAGAPSKLSVHSKIHSKHSQLPPPHLAPCSTILRAVLLSGTSLSKRRLMWEGMERYFSREEGRGAPSRGKMDAIVGNISSRWCLYRGYEPGTHPMDIPTYQDDTETASHVMLPYQHLSVRSLGTPPRNTHASTSLLDFLLQSYL